MPKLIRRTPLYEGKGRLEEVEVQVVHADGREHTTIDPVWVYGDSIAVLAFDRHAQTVLLVKQMRVAPFITEEITILEACAGGIEISDLSIEEACLREAQEELGCNLRNLQKVANVFINRRAWQNVLTSSSLNTRPVTKISKVAIRMRTKISKLSNCLLKSSSKCTSARKFAARASLL